MNDITEFGMDTLENSKRVFEDTKSDESDESNESDDRHRNPSKSKKSSLNANRADPTDGISGITLDNISQVNGCKKDEILKFQFFDGNTFGKIHLDCIVEGLKQISPKWEFISFINNSTGFVFRALDLNEVRLFTRVNKFIVNREEVKFEIVVVEHQIHRGISHELCYEPYSAEDILNNFDDPDILNVIKLTKKNDENIIVPSNSIIIEFKQVVKPTLKFGSAIAEVREISSRPMICFHCGLIGHTKKKCRKINVRLCRVCLNQHTIDLICVVKCKNCGSYHNSFDKRCPAFINENEIIQAKDKFGLNFFEASLSLESVKKLVNLNR